MKGSSKIRKIIIYSCLWILPIAAFLHHVFFLNQYVDRMIDMDYSGEMICGRMIYEERRIIPQNWIYTTELRVVNLPLIFSLFFHFLDDWHMVRILSSALLLLLLMGCACVAGYQLGLRKLLPLLVLVFVLPFSGTYMDYVISGLYYIPYICFLLITVAMMLYIFDMVDMGRYPIYAVLLFILSFVDGMTGFRMLLILYIPIFLTVLFMWKKGFFRDREQCRRGCMAGTGMMAAAFIGGLINEKLHQYYIFERQEQHFQEFDIDRISAVVNGILNCLGYSDGKADIWVLSRNLFCACTLLGAFLFLRTLFAKNGYDQKESNNNTKMIFFAFFAVTTNLLVILLCIFTDQKITPRYFIMGAVTVFFLLFLFLEKCIEKQKVYWLMVSAYILLLFFDSYGIYVAFRYQDKTEYLRGAVSYLMENGYHQGYSTELNAPQMTELSDGQIDVWALPYDRMEQWQQKYSHLTEKPDEKIFVLFQHDDTEKCPLKAMIDEPTVYQNGGVYIYAFTDYDALARKYLKMTE